MGPTKRRLLQLLCDVPEIEVIVTGDKDVPTALIIPFTLREAPLTNFKTALGPTINDTPEGIVKAELAISVPLTMIETPSVNLSVVPDAIVSVTQEETVILLVISIVPDRVIFSAIIYPVGQRFTAGSP